MRKLIYRLCNALLLLVSTIMLQYKVSTSSVVAEPAFLLIAFDKLNGLPLFLKFNFHCLIWYNL
jgi:hypothetical protein